MQAFGVIVTIQTVKFNGYSDNVNVEDKTSMPTVSSECSLNDWHPNNNKCDSHIPIDIPAAPFTNVV